MIIWVLCVRFEWGYSRRGWEFQGSNHSRGPGRGCEAWGAAYIDNRFATWLWAASQGAKLWSREGSRWCTPGVYSVMIKTYGCHHGLKPTRREPGTVNTQGRIVLKALRMIRCWDHRLCPHLEVTFRVGESLLVSRSSKLDHQLCYICSQNMKRTHKTQ